ncbi:MAG TPA: type II secretion system F family protein [Candidatus Saccharimonadales bacterium]|nr:type II secretion system F family protein [Candidatus Saccharimonadales bacterium]
MLTFKYTARDPSTGQYVKAEVQAEDEQSASKLIRKEGFVPIDIALAEKAATGLLRSRLNRVRIKDKVLFSRQLSTLINAGLPLVQSLRTVNSQTESKPLKIIVSKVISDVESGATLADAMGKHPQAFNRVYVSLVAAGEASGTLDKALERLAIQQEKDAELIRKVRGAMIYPIIVIAVMIGVVGFMIVKVLPQVKTLYEGLPGANLPVITRALLALSDFIIHFWWIVIIILGVLAFFTTRWARTMGGRRAIDKLKMRAWPVGTLFMKVYMARFSRTGTTLVASGVPLLQMLAITAEAVDNMYISESINKAIEKVKGGKSLAEALYKDPNFLELVPNMLRIGEQSGSMEQMMEKTADYYEKEVDDEVKSISTIIEPVLMVILGVVAFTIVAAVLLPIYGLANQSFIQQ